jgi:hypothetical protein
LPAGSDVVHEFVARFTLQADFHASFAEGLQGDSGKKLVEKIGRLRPDRLGYATAVELAGFFFNFVSGGAVDKQGVALCRFDDFTNRDIFRVLARK